MRDAWRLELKMAALQRTNLMLAGAGAVPVLLDMLGLELLNERVLSWHPGEPLDLPSHRRVATFILHDVDQLTPADQQALLQWLDLAAGRIRVISTTEEPLWARVTRGEFDEALYYRLNVVYLDLGAPAP
jgi:hypothetical protein